LNKIVKIIGWRMLTSLQKLLVILLQAGNNNVEEWLTVSEQIQLATAEAAVRLKQTCKPLVSIFGTPVSNYFAMVFCKWFLVLFGTWGSQRSTCCLPRNRKNIAKWLRNMARRTCSGTNTAASRTTKYPFNCCRIWRWH